MDNMDRDTTIKYFNEIIKEDFEIRWFVESLGDDTLAFFAFYRIIYGVV